LSIGNSKSNHVGAQGTFKLGFAREPKQDHKQWICLRSIGWSRLDILRGEYAERRLRYGILVIFSPVYDYSNLEYEHVHVIQGNQAEYGIHILVAASHEYVNTYSTCRLDIKRTANKHRNGNQMGNETSDRTGDTSPVT